MNYQIFILKLIIFISFIFISTQKPILSQDTEDSFQYLHADSTAHPILLTVRGGISKGSYQAGFNWGLLRFFHLSNSQIDKYSFARMLDKFWSNDYGLRDRFEIPVYTGASAGNINSILASIEWCRDDFLERGPKESLFWDIWTPVGIEQLFPKSNAYLNSRALFTRRYFDEILFSRFRESYNSTNVNRNCRVSLGITLTKVKPSTVEIEANIPIKIQSQRALSVFKNEVVKFTNERPRMMFSHHESTNNHFTTESLTRMYGQLVLPNFKDGEIIHEKSRNDSLVFEISKASSAFPIAFAPVKLNYTKARDNVLNGWNADNSLTYDYFLDGGAFDNYPVGAALNIYSFEKKYRNFNRDAKLIFIETSNYRESPSNADILRRMDISKYYDDNFTSTYGLGMLENFLSGFVSSARQYELETLARDKSKLGNVELLQTQHIVPIIGEYMQAFGAFFARPLREYDFYLGIYDAIYTASENFICENVDDKICIEENIISLLTEYDLPEESKYLFAKIFSYEFSESEQRNSFIKTYDVPISAIDNEKAKFFLLILDASLNVFDKFSHIPDSHPDKFINFIQELKRIDNYDFISEFVAKEVDMCRSKRGNFTRSNYYFGDCYFDPIFLELYENPSRTIQDLQERALFQLNQVEKESGNSKYKRLTNIGFYSLRNHSLYNERQFSGGNTVPRYDWQSYKKPEQFWQFTLRWIIPNEIQIDATNSRFQFGWMPQYRFNRYFALKAPVIRNISFNKNVSDFNGIGIGPSFNPTWWATMESRMMYSWEYGLDNNSFGVDVSLILGGKLRLGVHNYNLFYGSKRNSFDFGFTIGIVDLPGLRYWLWHTIKN